MPKISYYLLSARPIRHTSGFASPYTRSSILSLLSVAACLGVVTLSVDGASAQTVRVRSGNNGSGVANGLAEFTTNGGTSWTDLLIQVEFSTLYGNAHSTSQNGSKGFAIGDYNRVSDTSGILGRSFEGTTATVTAASLINIGDNAATGTGTGYQGTVTGTDSLQVLQVGGGEAAGQVYNRIFFSFAAPTANFFVNGLARSDNAGYDAILNYNTTGGSNMQTMDQFALNTTNPPATGNAIRTIANVPSSYTFGDPANFTGGGTQSFSIVWRNDPQPTSISFDVSFQPVPAPPAAVSLGIGGLVGLLGTGVNQLRARRRKHAAKKA